MADRTRVILSGGDSSAEQHRRSSDDCGHDQPRGGLIHDVRTVWHIGGIDGSFTSVQSAQRSAGDRGINCDD